MEVLSKDGAVISEDSVVVDGNITTSRGLGTAVDFALSLISQLENDEKAKEIAESVYIPAKSSSNPYFYAKKH